MLTSMSERRNILFYDGECGLCQRSVRFLSRRDRRGRLHFAPLQGETAAGIVPEEVRASMSTVAFHRADGALFYRSAGVLEALAQTGSGWRLLAKLLRLVPARLRDRVYDWIARNRAKLPGGGCPLPSPEQREQMLP